MRTLVLQCRRVVHPVGKTIPEVHKAYLAGFIDGNGAMMALIDRHPTRRFGCRVRIWVKATQLRQSDVVWLRNEPGFGQVRASRACWEWLGQTPVASTMASSSDSTICARQSTPDRYRFADPATQILQHRIESIDDLYQVADWTDALSALNVRSRGRRQNTAAMIQGFVSRND